MADAKSIEMRTRSHLTLPDSTLQLDRSPLKEARTTLRNQTVTSTEIEDGDSDEDPILLSPTKATSNSHKRALESPQTSYPQINSRYKRFKSSDPETSVPVHSANGKPSHFRHLSENTAVEKKGLAKGSAPPSVLKKSSTPALASQKPRAKSVPIFPSLPSIPSIDFRNPPASPTRSRSRSPEKREPKLDITFVTVATALDPIPDENESGMDLDTPIPQRRQRSGSEQGIAFVSFADATPKPPHYLAHSQESTATPDHTMRPSTPLQAFFLEPMSPLTPLVETPAPLEKFGTHSRDLAEDELGTPEAQTHSVPSNTTIPATPTPTTHTIDAGINSITSTDNDPLRIQRQSRVHLPRKPTANFSVNGGSSTGPPPTAASTSKYVGGMMDKKRTDAPKNAFSVLMDNRLRMTKKEKERLNKNKKTPGNMNPGKVTDIQDSGSKEAQRPSIKSKMKARTKPQQPCAIPTFADDEEEREQEMNKQDLPDSCQIPDESVRPMVSPEALDEPSLTIPSSPPTSLFSEDPHAETDSKNESSIERESRSSLFSLNDDDPLNPEASHSPLDTGSHSGHATPETTGAFTEPGVEVMIIKEPDARVPSPLEATAVEQDTFPSGKGKAKRAPRKKAVVSTIRRPTHVTRSMSSRQHEIEVPVQTSLDSEKESSRNFTTRNVAPAETPPSTRNRQKKVDPTDPISSLETNILDATDIFSNSEVSKAVNDGYMEDPVPISESLDRPSSALSSELSSLSSDSEDEPEIIKSNILQPSASSKSMTFQLLVKSKLAPSPSLARATQASLARAALPKTPAKTRLASPSKLSRSSSMFAPRLNDNQNSRPELAVAGSSYVALENVLDKLREAPPSRPNTSMGFHHDSLEDESDVQMQSKDDASVDRSTLGIGRPSSAASSSGKSGLPVFKRPAPISKDSRGIFMQSGKGPFANRRQGAIMHSGLSIYDRIAGGARGQKASQKTALPTVIGSPAKGDGAATTKDDVIMGNAAGPWSAQGHLTVADLIMSDADMEAESSRNGKKKAREDKSRRASMALHALSQSLNDLSGAKAAEVMQPPTLRRVGLRSSSSTYPLSSTGKNSGDSKKELTPPRLSVLDDCKVFVDYRSEDPLVAETWVQMLKDLGARIMTRLGPTCTHILWKDGLSSTISRYRRLNDPKPFVVGNNWVVSCAQESKRVDETEFLIDLNDYTFAAAGHKRRKSMIPKFSVNYGDNDDTEKTVTQDVDVSMDSNTSISNDLTPLERARLRQSMRI